MRAPHRKAALEGLGRHRLRMAERRPRAVGEASCAVARQRAKTS
jgi:hypothetical protein